jgi:hypothetical protein
MKPITFYTDKDIPRFVKDRFNHRAELITETVYLTPVTDVSKSVLNRICRLLDIPAFVKEVKILYAGNKALIILTCTLVKNYINCASHTRNIDILLLNDELCNLYNATSPGCSLVLSHATATVNGCALEVYQDESKKEPVNIFKEIISPLLLQLDQFMDNH